MYDDVKRRRGLLGREIAQFLRHYLFNRFHQQAKEGNGDNGIKPFTEKIQNEIDNLKFDLSTKIENVVIDIKNLLGRELNDLNSDLKWQVNERSDHIIDLFNDWADVSNGFDGEDHQDDPKPYKDEDDPPF